MGVPEGGSEAKPFPARGRNMSEYLFFLGKDLTKSWHVFFSKYQGFSKKGLNFDSIQTDEGEKT